MPADSTVAPPANQESRSATHYAVRIGFHGQVGRFVSPLESYRRGTQVICRTARGLEIGTVLNALQHHSSTDQALALHATDGQIVRRMVAEDQLLWNHLLYLARQSHAECQSWLEQTHSRDQLLDVEPLLDGKTLYFHFLNKVSAETEAQLDQLVAIFQQTVAASQFANLLENGCGPGCGTSAAAKGCGSACQSCTAICKR